MADNHRPYTNEKEWSRKRPKTKRERWSEAQHTTQPVQLRTDHDTQNATNSIKPNKRMA